MSAELRYQGSVAQAQKTVSAEDVNYVESVLAKSHAQSGKSLEGVIFEVDFYIPAKAKFNNASRDRAEFVAIVIIELQKDGLVPVTAEETQAPAFPHSVEKECFDQVKAYLLKPEGRSLIERMLKPSSSPLPDHVPIMPVPSSAETREMIESTDRLPLYTPNESNAVGRISGHRLGDDRPYSDANSLERGEAFFDNVNAYRSTTHTEEGESVVDFAHDNQRLAFFSVVAVVLVVLALFLSL
ncbi:hypothetical protein EJ04DRAFT_360950 [Polyplosphaeria fusca]|uniref:Uncharacterized protein n=1 Tax=Polyplosphaeria fusca TaxID=682080 RepID=A0A9P4QVS0_9PLEO|nr:hypothetical protein EJ04DRAFT_360950 [Polyplosphaeria fusca]